MKNKILICVTCCSILFLHHSAISQAPNLGTGSSFALFTAVGAFDNLGFTVVDGDIGTNAGAFTGFPPGFLSGSAFIGDATSLQAANDINIAYNELVATPCDTMIGPLLGGGQTLPPGVYCIGAASTLTGDLILDGQGDPNATFIIKIDGAFSLSNSSKVLLIDSAVWCNVYWQVNGAFILNNDAVFRGTIINNGAISMLESSDMVGRGLSIAGAIDLHNNTITNDCFILSPLPIELISFTADCINGNAIIHWSTSSETNNDFFSLERSIDVINWQTAGITSGAGYSNMILNYSFTDTHPLNGISYYRLKQTDFDGAFNHSEIISISSCQQQDGTLDMYPNPTTGPLNLRMDGFADELASVEIYNTNGTVIYSSQYLPPMIDLSNQQAGVYFIFLQSTTGVVTRKFIIKK